jgi:two-component system capsular synthesis response regulator RcsB
MSIRVILADDHPVVRFGVKAALDQSGTCTVVAEASSADELHVALARHPCDVVVTDLTMPGGEANDGVELIRKLVADHPLLRIVVFTSAQLPSILQALITAGAHGMLDKSSAMRELPTAIVWALQGRRYISAYLTQRMAESGHASSCVSQQVSLSPREAEVVRLLASGCTNVDIAEQLGLSHKTVSRHKREAMRKLSATSESDLYEAAMKLGLGK